MIEPKSVGENLYEWKDITPESECGWQAVEKVARAVVMMQGDASVLIFGTLFAEGDGIDVVGLTPAAPILTLDPIPWRVRPRVVEGTATVRLYIPRGL